MSNEATFSDEGPPLLIVHRDCGPGFTHFDSPDCGCCPTVVEVADDMTSDQVIEIVEREQRKH